MAGSKPRLSRREWADAGLKALETEGYPAVRADRLAAALGVSRGSFYWHFPDVRAFEAALIERWREIVLEALDPPRAPDETALDRFATIMRRSLLTTRRLELQFRAWAAVDANVRSALDQVDANRLAYFEKLLGDAGRAREDVSAIARIAYWTYLGRMQAPVPDEQGVERVVEHLVRLVGLLDEASPEPRRR
jgi:AcrR family transcriptional regulator